MATDACLEEGEDLLTTILSDGAPVKNEGENKGREEKEGRGGKKETVKLGSYPVKQRNSFPDP